REDTSPSRIHDQSGRRASLSGVLMIRAEPSLNRDGNNVWFGQYCTGRFWHTVRHDADGKAVGFPTKKEALETARREWWVHVTPRAHAGEGVRYVKAPKKRSKISCPQTAARREKRARLPSHEL